MARDGADAAGRPGPSDLGSAVALLARLGGCRRRKHDPAPGNWITWEIYNGLTLETMGCRLLDSQLAARWRGALTGAQTRFVTTR